MSTTELFLIAMLIILAIPYLIWRLGQTDYYAPLVVVQIIAGVLLGPGILGSIFPDYYQSILTPAVLGAINGIAWWSVMIYVCIAGIELDLRQAWERRRETGITAGFALVTPLLFGCVVALGLLRIDGWIGPAARPWQFVVGIGLSCAVTALPILILLMQKLEILRQPLGQRILRYASLDDIAIWGVLALILLDWSRLGRQIGFLVVFVIVTFGFRLLMVRLKEADRWYMSLIWLAACGLATDWAGLHFMVGAFLAGAVMDSHWFDQKRMDLMRDHVLLVGMPVFFLNTGLRTNWSVGGSAVLIVAAVLLFTSVAGKLFGMRIAGRLLRWAPGDASIIGWLMQTKALIMIIFVNMLLDNAIITAEMFTALLIMAVGSTMLTVPVVQPKLQALKNIAAESSNKAKRAGSSRALGSAE